MIPSSDQIASDSRPNSLADPSRQRQAPGGVDAPAVRAQHAQAPVADLVAEALDDDRAVARDDARRRPAARAGSRARLRGGAARRGRSRARAPRRPGRPPSGENSPIASPSSFGRPTLSPFQNGTAPGTPGRRRDDHAVAADLLDPPGRRAEQERLARRAPRRPSPRRARRRGGRRAATTLNRPRSGIVPALAIASARAPLRARIVPATRSQTMRGAQLAELLRRVAAVEHVEDVLEQRRGGSSA